MDRYKGLGEMNKEDMRITISDPSTRKLYQVTSIGDAESIAALMGKDSLKRRCVLSISSHNQPGGKSWIS